MGTYETELGYIVRETLGGLEVTEDDKVICTLDGKTLEADIREVEEAEDFLAYQKEYC